MGKKYAGPDRPSAHPYKPQLQTGATKAEKTSTFVATKGYVALKGDLGRNIQMRVMLLQELKAESDEYQNKLARIQANVKFVTDSIELTILDTVGVDIRGKDRNWGFNVDGPDGPFLLLQGTEPPPNVQAYLAEKAAKQQAPQQAQAAQQMPAVAESTDPVLAAAAAPIDDAGDLPTEETPARPSDLVVAHSLPPGLPKL